MGEVTLTMRSMLRKRSGRPRSEISSAGLALTQASATAQARRASLRFPAASATTASGADAPPSPPAKRYHGISQLQIGSFRTGRP